MYIILKLNIIVKRLKILISPPPIYFCDNIPIINNNKQKENTNNIFSFSINVKLINNKNIN